VRIDLLRQGETLEGGTRIGAGVSVWATNAKGVRGGGNWSVLLRASDPRAKLWAGVFIFLVQPNPGAVPGHLHAGVLQLGRASLDGVVVPSSAVLRHEGKSSVYVEIRRADKFKRDKINPWSIPTGQGAGS